MKRFIFTILLLLPILFSAAADSPAATITLDSDDMMTYALSLIKKGDYDTALHELKRLIHFFPREPIIPRARYYEGLCLLGKGDHEKARAVFHQIARESENDRLKAMALFKIGESYYGQGIYKESDYYFMRVLNMRPGGKLKNAAFYMLGWSRADQDKWDEASQYFGKVEGDEQIALISKRLAHDLLDAEKLPEKDPVKAGVMAGLLPGMGHAYVNRYRDALIAFLMNGLFVWAAAESFNKDHEVLGGILTFLELGWYSGNIYSAVNVAHKYNKDLRQNFRDRIRQREHMGRPPGKEGGFCLGFSLDF
jgi:tetratricopeptide (TPR) repeat protein